MPAALCQATADMAATAAHISHLGTALPGQPIDQEAIGDWLAPRLPDARARARWRRLLCAARVSARHSVLDLLGEDAGALHAADGRGLGTAARSQLYARHALPLAVAAVQAAGLDAVAGVTHLVVATCTGAIAPGLDLQLARALGLPGSVKRTVIGFMGCYAAIQALRVARDACAADGGAQVLVVCCELCTLHLGATDSESALVAASLFADGASAALVRPGAGATGSLAIRGDQAAVIPFTDEHMMWYAGDQGFVLGLSRAVTGAIGAAIAPVARDLLAGRPPSEARWVVHPGGPRILDACESALGLGDGALAGSRAALAGAGNRSSGTILAILEDELRAPWRGEVGLMAFGPGLTAEAMLLERA